MLQKSASDLVALSRLITVTMVAPERRATTSARDRIDRSVTPTARKRSAKATRQLTL